MGSLASTPFRHRRETAIQWGFGGVSPHVFGMDSYTLYEGFTPLVLPIGFPAAPKQARRE